MNSAESSMDHVVSRGLGWPSSRPVLGDASGQGPSALGWPGASNESEATSGAVDLEIQPDLEPPDDVAADPSPHVSRETSPVKKDPMSTPLARAVADEARRRRVVEATETARPKHTRVLTVANQKGGVGKTTTTVNLAAAMSQLGMNVLVIDIDPQGNASTALGVPHHSGVPGIYDVLIDGVALEDVVQPASTLPRLWCAPATIDLAGAEIELVPLVAREARLRKALEKFMAKRQGDERIDFVFIDCPPSLGLLTVNAFVSAQEVLIPIQTEYYALEGVSQLMSNIKLIREHLNPVLRVSTILLTMFDARTRLSAQVADEVRQHFPDEVLKTLIPRSVRISEAPSFGETVMTYDPASTGALSYREAAVEMTSSASHRGAATEEYGVSNDG